MLWLRNSPLRPLIYKPLWKAFSFEPLSDAGGLPSHSNGPGPGGGGAFHSTPEMARVGLVTRGIEVTNTHPATPLCAVCSRYTSVLNLSIHDHKHNYPHNRVCPSSPCVHPPYMNKQPPRRFGETRPGRMIFISKFLSL